MLKTIVLLLILCNPAALLAQYWQQKTDYVIDVTLNDKEHALEGFEKITYTNHSPDTLFFIWFHIWPNAFKNDKTAFSEQLLINGRTDFYFSNKDQRGYINRLDFKVNDITAQTEDHPQYIDIIKLKLPQPLAPGASTNITTPFHIQLPENFSRGGHNGQAYLITQWFPKPAVYDRKGWHPIPYLDQGEFYSEFGNFDVRITLPENYVVAATGTLQNTEEKQWLQNRTAFNWKPVVARETIKKGSTTIVKKKTQLFPESAISLKTLRYIQDNVHDFAWFADKRFRVMQDSIQLPSGKIITAYSYYLPEHANAWNNSIAFIKKAIHFRSELIGEYPYNTISVVDAKMGLEGGMEYPGITSISLNQWDTELETTIEHEIGHNWFQGLLASNERQFPWMDEGMNTYYDNRYKASMRPAIVQNTFFKKRLPNEFEPLLFQTITGIKKDQAINTPSEDFNYLNYALVAYFKTGEWMRQLELQLGRPVFDNAMRSYFGQWQYKHPYPEDFKTVLESVSGKNEDSIFNLLSKTGTLIPLPKKHLKPVAFFNFTNPEKYSYINFLPALGFNQYDKLMVGMLIHNYGLPFNKLQFLAAPLFGTGSSALNGIGRISYSDYHPEKLQKIEYYLGAARFSTNRSLDTFGNKKFESFFKIAPGIKIVFKHAPLSNSNSNVDFRLFLIGEKNFSNYSQKSTDSSNFYPTELSNNFRYITQLSYHLENNRALYPYQLQLQLQQGKNFYRLNSNAHYYFNYAKGGGLQVRFFAALFGYIGGQTSDAFIYQPKLLGVRGEEDYTYSNYFLGRTASIANGDAIVSNKGLGAQQIMMRDGGLKLILDQYGYLQGRSEQWVSSLNFTSTLPRSIFPDKFPLKLFFDIGTYAEAWKPQPQTSRFLYTGGLQLSLFKNVLNVYLPILYSSDFKTVVKSTWPSNTLLNTLSFSIDIQNIQLRKLNKYLDF